MDRTIEVEHDAIASVGVCTSSPVQGNLPAVRLHFADDNCLKTPEVRPRSHSMPALSPSLKKISPVVFRKTPHFKKRPADAPLFKQIFKKLSRNAGKDSSIASATSFLTTTKGDETFADETESEFHSALQASQLFGFDGHDLSDDVDVEAVSSLDAKHEKLEEDAKDEDDRTELAEALTAQDGVEGLLHDQVIDLKKELARMQSALDAKSEELDRKSAEADRLAVENSDLKRKNASLESDNEVLRADAADLAQQRDCLLKEKEGLALACMSLQDEAKDLRGQLKEAQAQQDILAAASSEQLRALTEENAGLANNKQELEHQVDELTHKLEEAETALKNKSRRLVRRSSAGDLDQLGRRQDSTYTLNENFDTESVRDSDHLGVSSQMPRQSFYIKKSKLPQVQKRDITKPEPFSFLLREEVKAKLKKEQQEAEAKARELEEKKKRRVLRK